MKNVDTFKKNKSILPLIEDDRLLGVGARGSYEEEEEISVRICSDWVKGVYETQTKYSTAPGGDRFRVKVEGKTYHVSESDIRKV